MQCLKQFQRSKQHRHANQGDGQDRAQAAEAGVGIQKQGMTISLQSVTPIATQNVAMMPISTKSNKSQKSTKSKNQMHSNASMAAEAHA